MANQNLMQVNGQDDNGSATYLTVNLANDDEEVRGFGQVIARERAKRMAKAYFDKCKAGTELIQKMETHEACKPLRELEQFNKDKPQFEALKNIIAPETQTVSGVFGKEILLLILSMRTCEGIRYIIGNDGEKNTVILIGVTEAPREAGTSTAVSAPIDLVTDGKTLGTNDRAIDGEVHGHSMNIKQVEEFLSTKSDFFKDPTDVLFGSF